MTAPEWAWPGSGTRFDFGAPGDQACGAVASLACLMGEEGCGSDQNARALLSRRGLPELANADLGELVDELGLGIDQARRILAGFDLVRLLQRHREVPRAPMGSAQRVHDYLGPYLLGLEQETFLALLLDGKHRLRRGVCVSVGTLTTSLVHPREVFRPAIRSAAAAIVVAHNHPSGDPEPSPEDIEVTHRLRRVGELVGIPLLDHVILAGRSFVSLRERLPEMAPQPR